MVYSRFKRFYIEAIILADTEANDDDECFRAETLLLGTSVVVGFDKTLDNLFKIDFKVRSLLAERKGVTEESLLRQQLLIRADKRDAIDERMRIITEYISLKTSILSLQQRGEDSSGHEETLQSVSAEMNNEHNWVIPLFICRTIIQNLKRFPEYDRGWAMRQLIEIVDTI